MRNKKGFTLTEVLLAAMIVGLIGVALAALITSSTREGSMGRTRVMLRNQISNAMRLMRQDIHQANSISLDSSQKITLTSSEERVAGRNNAYGTVVYELNRESSGELKRIRGGSSEVLLKHVQSAFTSFELINQTGQSGTMNSLLRVKILVKVGDNPSVMEVADNTFSLPNGFAVSE